MKTLLAGLLVMTIPLVGLTHADSPAPAGPTTSSEAANIGGLLVTVVVPRTVVQTDPLTVRVEIKNTLDRVARIYTVPDRWHWQFRPADGKGFWKPLPQYAELRTWSGPIDPGKTLSMSFTSNSPRGQEYVFDWVADDGSLSRLSQERNSLPAGRYQLAIAMEMSTFSRPTPDPEPWEGKLLTKPVEFDVGNDEAAATTQPAAYPDKFTLIGDKSISFNRGGHVVTLPTDDHMVIVLRHGKPGKLADLRVGQTARITLDESGARAVKIEVEGPKWECGSVLTGPPDAAMLIPYLSSDDGKMRAGATWELFALGKDALVPLEKAGAKQISPFGTIDTRRIDMVYSLIAGLKPVAPGAKAGFTFESFGLRVTKDCTADDLAKMGREYNFTLSGEFRPDAVPSCYVQLKAGVLAKVLKAILSNEPKVISVNLNYVEQ